MQIYIEKVIILNIIIHLILIITTNYITNNKPKISKIIISIILGTINLVYYLLYPNYYMKYLIIIIAFITFVNIKSTLIYLMLNFILGGITGVVNLSINFYYEVIILASVVILFVIFYFKQETEENITIIIKTKEEHHFKAFYDTGCLINVGLTPVIILNEKYDIKLSYFTSIEVNTIAGVAYKEVYKAEGVYIYKNNKMIEKHCLVIKSNIEYDVIIGKNFIGGI